VTAVILQGFNLSTSQATASDTLQASLDVNQSIVHAHFAMFNGVNKDGSWMAIPMWHPSQTASLPYYPLKLADDLWKRGQLYLMTWATRNLKGASGKAEPMTSADICAGKYDVYLHQSAKYIAAWKHPIVIALNAEFNWSGNINFQPGPDFVAMWRYIVDLFRKDGATNVSWSWHANQLGKAGNGQTTAEDRLPEWWPGIEWVDLVGMDVYNAAASRNSDWLTFDQIMTGAGTTWLGNTYGALEKLAPNTPKVIGEFGCHTVPGDKVAWLKDAFDAIPKRYADIMIASYYGIDDGAAKWSLHPEDGTAQAYGDSIEEGPYVQGGQFIMPPDLQPLKPFTRAIASGDPLADLVQAQAQLGKLSSVLDAAVKDRDSALTEAQRISAELDDIRAARDAAQAALQASAEYREPGCRQHGVN
jgi:hypothetical protein